MGLENIRRLKEEARLPKPEKRYSIPKVSEKKKKHLAEQKKESKGPSELQRWFNERRKEMAGNCSHCGKPSCKNSDEWFRASLAHIFPKRLFKSVATHPLNWIELCFWGNNCHQSMDDNILDLTEMNCFDEIIEKAIAIYPDIDPKERKYIPDVLMQYIKDNS